MGSLVKAIEIVSGMMSLLWAVLRNHSNSLIISQIKMKIWKNSNFLIFTACMGSEVDLERYGGFGGLKRGVLMYILGLEASKVGVR